MYRKLLIPLAMAAALCLSACSPSELPDSTADQSDISQPDISKPDEEEIHNAKWSVEMNSYNKKLTTAKCSDSENAADFTSLTVDAEPGDCIAFDNVKFNDANSAHIHISAANTWIKKPAGIRNGLWTAFGFQRKTMPRMPLRFLIPKTSMRRKSCRTQKQPVKNI